MRRIGRYNGVQGLLQGHGGGARCHRGADQAGLPQASSQVSPGRQQGKDAEARFKEVGEAYEVLKSPEKRAAYDQLGQGPRPGEEFRPPPDWGTGFEFSGSGARDSDYSDFFEALFGARGGAGNRRGAFHPGQGVDHHAKVLLDLDATLHGGARQLSLRVPEIDGEGRLVSKERVLNVQVPKGILAGQHIRLAGQGARPPGEGTPGDLFIEVEFQPHPLYRVDGRDLYLDLPVAPWEAALGATVKTPTPTGTVDLKIPPGSHAGTKLRLKGRGIPASPPGDFYIILQIALPPVKDDKAKAAYAAMAAAVPFNPRANLGV